MKKYALKYIRDDGKEYWADSVDENGQTYRLMHTKKDEPYPYNHYAEVWYGKNAVKEIQKRIKKDKGNLLTWSCIPVIVQFEEEPIWFFELWYALSYFYNDRTHQPIRKGFKYNTEKYTERPRISELELEELKEYYNWRKNHFKGKLKEE